MALRLWLALRFMFVRSHHIRLFPYRRGTPDIVDVVLHHFMKVTGFTPVFLPPLAACQHSRSEPPTHAGSIVQQSNPSGNTSFSLSSTDDILYFRPTCSAPVCGAPPSRSARFPRAGHASPKSKRNVAFWRNAAFVEYGLQRLLERVCADS